ncbi:SDR family oxidoreductase [Pseudonocardia xishanensis]|uniref:SDR family oxidoreductase n=1 Tax=Pseudonocardia xishanensis TaxID=630995 RepID=A0ABP8RVG1_9PSEU
MIGEVEVSFENRVVVVTGAAGGFGSAISEGFGAAGAHVVVSDVDIPGAEKVAASLPSALAIGADVTDPEAMRSLVDAAVGTYGRVDIMVNNAGLPHLAAPMIEMSVEEVDAQLAVNVRSVFLGCKFAVPAMRRTAGGGVIVNVASIAGRRPRPGMTVYNATKGAVITLTRGLAGELAPDVRVNALNPVVSETGFIKNSMGVDTLSEEARAQLVAGIPMGRTAVPTDVANAAVYLASDQAGFLTGVCLDVDGGRSIA